ATQRVSGCATGTGGSDVQIHLVNQDVGAAGSRVANRKNHLSWQLVFQVDVVLLNDSLLEVEVLRKDVSAERTGVVCQWSENREPSRPDRRRDTPRHSSANVERNCHPIRDTA